MQLSDGDSLLRHVSYADQLIDGVVDPGVFKARASKGETSLSFTLRADELESPAQLKDYQQKVRLPSGDLPGICWLSISNFRTTNVAVRHDPEPLTVNPYGDLHCSSDVPDSLQRKELARLATKNGVLCPFVKGPRI